MTDKFAKLMIGVSKNMKKGCSKRAFLINTGHVAKSLYNKNKQPNQNGKQNSSIYNRNITPYSWLDFVTKDDIDLIKKGGFLSPDTILKRAAERGIDLSDYLPKVNDRNLDLAPFIKEIIRKPTEKYPEFTFDDRSARGILESRLKRIYGMLGWDPYVLKDYVDKHENEQRLLDEFISRMMTVDPDHFKKMIQIGKDLDTGRKHLTEDDKNSWENYLMRIHGTTNENIPNIIANEKEESPKQAIRDLFGKPIPFEFSHFNVDDEGHPVIIPETGDYDRSVVMRKPTLSKYNYYASQIFKRQKDEWTKFNELCKNLTGYSADQLGMTPRNTLWFQIKNSTDKLLNTYNIRDAEGNRINLNTPERFFAYYFGKGSGHMAGTDISDDNRLFDQQGADNVDESGGSGEGGSNKEKMKLPIEEDKKKNLYGEEVDENEDNDDI